MVSSFDIGGFDRSHVFEHTLNPKTFDHFSRYDYKGWVPPQIRKDFVRTWTGSGEFLDIGCGAFPVSMDVEGARQRGVGVDVAPEVIEAYAQYLKDLYLFDIENIALEEIPSFRSRFGTVILSETLEHFMKPLEVLRKLRTFIRPGGRLLVTYPNAFSIAQLLDYYMHGGEWSRFKLFHASHVYLVKKRELESLFQRAGFKMVYFDFRASDIVEGFPREQTRLWRHIASFMPSFLAHQFFYVLEREECCQ